jgi:hypothetical protein
MSRSAAACATQAGSNWYVVTLPDGRIVISSQPLLHNKKSAAVNALTTKSIKELDANVVLFLAYLELINIMPDRCVSKTKLPAFSVWNNICVFLTGKPFFLYYENEYPARKLARLSIALSCPYLLFSADQVVHAALNGDEDLAHRMIKANPRYLLSRETVTDFSGRTYTDLTPFQAALVTGDDAMAKMMKPYFDRLQDGQVKMQKQVSEIFPNGIEEHEKSQKEKSETKFKPMLDAVTDTIKKASPADLQAALSLTDNNSTLRKALDIFRAAFTGLSHAEASKEKIFNPHYLLAAFEAYANKFDWNTPDWNKSNLFWRQVIGFVQRFLPATYAQAFAYGLYDIVEKKHSCPRLFNFKYDLDFSFYPLGRSSVGLGFNFGRPASCGSGHCTCPCLAAWGTGESGRCCLGRFSKLMSNKNSKLTELITPRAQSTHSCVMQ